MSRMRLTVSAIVVLAALPSLSAGDRPPAPRGRDAAIPATAALATMPATRPAPTSSPATWPSTPWALPGDLWHRAARTAPPTGTDALRTAGERTAPDFRTAPKG